MYHIKRIEFVKDGRKLYEHILLSPYEADVVRIICPSPIAPEALRKLQGRYNTSLVLDRGL